jgi:ACS family hexuronate transporter-like MFS transporter
MGSRSLAGAWKWYVCFLLLLATMLNYMDRQTLSLLVTDIGDDFHSRGLEFRNVDYGYLERAFGIAFAVGSLATGFLVDRVGVRLLYPAVLLGWSAAGFATAWADNFTGLLLCRTALGFFEAGQWPCALTASQRLLAPRERMLGNGILQSGAALGAILTPLVVQTLAPNPGDWPHPFRAIGALGLLWIVGWFLLIGRADLPNSEPEAEAERSAQPAGGLARRLFVLIVVVVSINLCWHYFRAWLPKFLREFHGYQRHEVNYFIMAYYLATDLGSLSAGFMSRGLAGRGWTVHAARLLPFAACALLTSLSTVAAFLPAGWPLLATLLVIGFGALGLFPGYYAFSQELSTRHVGKVVGLLGFVNWIVTALMHPLVGRQIDETQSYAAGLFAAGLVPLVGLAALLLFWDRRVSVFFLGGRTGPPSSFGVR